MSADKYPSIFSRQMKVIVYLSPEIATRNAPEKIGWAILANQLAKKRTHGFYKIPFNTPADFLWSKTA